MTDNGPARLPHAALDLDSRARKALKIERLLGLEQAAGNMRLLEVGAGSGGISHYFGTHPSGRFDVDAVDVVDSRIVRDGYRYSTVPGTALPFSDATFDVVISNHVIEHVGDAQAQLHHLKELHRVLKPDGMGYLAVPNRWMLIEPHYRLVFLSWWPEKFRTPWLRLWRRGDVYDCRPLERKTLQSALCLAQFGFAQIHGRALRTTFEIERPGAPIYGWFLRHIPDRIYGLIGAVFPTLIYKLMKGSG